MSKRREKKSHGFRNFILYCLILFAIWYIGTCTLKTNEITVESEKIKEDVTIVQITDLHGAVFGDGNKYLIEKIKEANPDFIVSTGDMYTARDEEGRKTAEELLAELAKSYTVYAVNGEHDYDDDFEEALRDAGVTLLKDEAKDIKAGGGNLRIYGISNVYYPETFDLRDEFDVDKSRFNLMLAHISHTKAFSEAGMDLALCGDTHGGQIRLPFVGALYNRGVWLPEKSDGEEKYTKGLYETDGTKVFVSCGLGTYPVPVRFLARPEVAVICLKGK